MKTIRRLYFYTVAGISLEVVLWGIIGLLRTIFSRSLGGVYSLAIALALILAGIPIFLIHWLVIQNSARKDEEERLSPLRGVFLYIVEFGLLVPVIQNILAIVDRVLLPIFDLSDSYSILGAGQTYSDNFIAIFANLLLAFYFYKILQQEWASETPPMHLALIRRIYRYLWALYGLGMSAIGTTMLFRYIFWILAVPSSDAAIQTHKWLHQSLALLLVGIPLWFLSWKNIQQRLDEPEERGSIVRLGVIYFVVLSSAVFSLGAGGDVLTTLLQAILGSGEPFREILKDSGGSLAVLLTAGSVWGYHGYWLQRTLASIPEAPTRGALRRIYNYLLSLIGLSTTFLALEFLLSLIVSIITKERLWGSSLRNSLAGSFAFLLVGIPTYLFAWIPMQAEALSEDEKGDHARRSLTRKGYLYLALFVGIIGVMITGVRFLYLIISALLGAAQDVYQYLQALQLFILFSILAAYHWKLLRADNRHTARNLEERHAAYPVLLLTEDENAPPIQRLLHEIKKETPALPVLLHPPSAPPEERVKEAKALLIPGEILFSAPESLHPWFEAFSGEKIIIPAPSADEKWIWAGIGTFSYKEAAKTLRRLAEGEEKAKKSRPTLLVILAYVFGASILLQILFGLLAILGSALMTLID